MNITEIAISVTGFMIVTLIGIVGYLLNRQLVKVDNKVDLVDQEFFKIKSSLVDIAQTSRLDRVDKKAMLDHLEKEIMPQLKLKGVEDQISAIRSDVTILKEYQRNRIAPTLDRIMIMGDKLDEQQKKQSESDLIIGKMFEVVKRLVEKKDKP